jgi:hypothetical protein
MVLPAHDPAQRMKPLACNANGFKLFNAFKVFEALGCLR